MSEDHKGDKFFFTFTILIMLKEGKNPPTTSFSVQIDQDPELVWNLLKSVGIFQKVLGLGSPMGFSLQGNISMQLLVKSVDKKFFS